MTTNRPGSCVDGSARSRWTDAHAEAARFLGECFGAGALPAGLRFEIGTIEEWAIWLDGIRRR